MVPPVSVLESQGSDNFPKWYLLSGKEAFTRAVRIVNGFKGNQIYSPVFPSIESHEIRQLRTNREVDPNANIAELIDGPILPAEAVAAQILLEECHAMVNTDLTHLIKTDDIGSQHKEDILNKTNKGIAMFCNMLRSVAWVRKELLENKSVPNGTAIEDKIKIKFWNDFSEPLKKDGMKIGRNTAIAIVESIRTEMRGKILMEIKLDENRDPKSAPIEPNLNHYALGAKKAADLFLEACDLALSQFPNNGQTELH